MGILDDAEVARVYYLAGNVDPTQRPVSAPRGGFWLYTATGQWYQKNDNGPTTNWTLVQFGGGGGGGNIQVLLADPPAPAQDEQWFLKTPPQEPTFVTSQIGNPGLGSWIDIAIPNPTNADIAALMDPFSQGGWTTITWTHDVKPPDGVIINPQSAGVLAFQVNDSPGPTPISEVVAAFNAFSQARIGKNIATAGGDPNADFFGTIGAPSNVAVLTDAVPETMQLKIRGTGITFGINIPNA